MSAAATAVEAALAQLRVPYKWGAEQPGFGFDCSGLVQYAYSKAGVSLPRTAGQQQAATEPVRTPARGDLVFYGDPAHHVGLYLGDGQMVAAPHTGDVVKTQPVYAATDGPQYRRVKDSGAGSPLDVVRGVAGGITGAIGNVAGGAAGVAGDAVSAAAGAAVSALGPVLTKTAVIGLGLALIGAGAIVAVRPGRLIGLGGGGG